jgi:putative peptidoglycan lipid II flippase
VSSAWHLGEENMAEMKNVAKYSVIITGLLILSKLSGFVNDFILAALFGATREADIFRTSVQIPNSLYSAMAAALVTSFIPVFADVKKDKVKANEFFNNILNILLVICTLLAVLGIIFAPFLTKLFAKGFEAEVFSRTVQMTRIVMPSIIFLGISGLYAGYLQSYGTFIQPAITGITTNTIIIVGLLLFYKYGIIAAVVSFFLGSIAQVLVQRPFMKKYKYKPFINLKDEHVRKMLILAVPTIISTAVSQISPMVTNSFASSVEGNIAVLSYANKFSTILIRCS